MLANNILLIKEKNKLYKALLEVDFIRFCMVGSLGFVVNLSVLSIIHYGFGVSIFFAQLVSAEIALFGNFLLHHNWTYKNHSVRKKLRRVFIEFHFTSWAAILMSAVIVSVSVNYIGLHYIVALIASSIIVLMWNFFWTRYYIWRKSLSQTEPG